MTDEYIIKEYGPENLVKVKRNLNNGPAESKRRFLVKYPAADTSRFEFSSELTRSGDVGRYTVFYKTDADGGYDITSNTFKNNKKWVWYLHQWSRIWSGYGTVQPYVRNPVGTPYKINTVRIYVNNTQFFDAVLPEISLTFNSSDDDIETN